MKGFVFLVVAIALLSSQVVVADVIVGYGQRARVYDEKTWTPLSTEYDFGDSHYKVVSSAFMPNGNVALSYTATYPDIALYSWVSVYQPSDTGAWTELSTTSNWGTPIMLDAMPGGDIVFQWQGVASTFNPATWAQTSTEVNFSQWGYTIPNIAVSYDGRLLLPYNQAPSYGFVSFFSLSGGVWHEDSGSQNLTPVTMLDSMPNGDVLAAHGLFAVERYIPGTSWTAPYGSMAWNPATVAEFAGMPDGRVVVAYNHETNGNFLSTMSMNPDGTWNNDTTSPNLGVPITTVSAKRSGSVTGQIELKDYQGDLSLLPIRIELIPQGSGTAKTVEFKITTNPGTYSIAPDSGTYNLVFSSGKCLQKLVEGVTVAYGTPTTVEDVALINGDVDGSLEVNSTDLSVVLGGLDTP